MQSVCEIIEILKQQLQQLGVTEIVDDTRKIGNNSAFFCNEKAKESKYDVQAIKLGAKVVIQISSAISYRTSELPYINIESWSLYIQLLKKFYSHQNLKLIAVTGTNGKTSTVHFGASLCSLLGVKSATIGTNGICVYENGVVTSTEKTGLTTATCTQNHHVLANLEQSGVSFVFMEISSIGIEQGRLDGLAFDISCFSNFTQDHLDYHHTMEEYFAQKLKLFTHFTKESGLCVLNDEDEKSHDIAKHCKKNGLNYVFFGKYDDILKSYKINQNGFMLDFGSTQTQFNVSGNFQILNLMCIVHALLFFGFDIEQIASNIPILTAPLGRMQSVVINGITFVVDYAHTPDALFNVLNSIDGFKICVFGCGGNRDSSKREIMGEVASMFSDFVIITNDNPRFENPKTIAKDIESGIVHENYCMILDRKSAITFAKDMCEKMSKNGGTVIIAGKGSEDYQEINGVKTPFSDMQVVESLR